MRSKIFDNMDLDIFEEAGKNNEWSDSPFLNVKQLAPGAKGKVYEAQTKAILANLGKNVQDRENIEHDCILEGIKTEIKGSCKNVGKDYCSFLQIRPNDDYVNMLLLFVYPNPEDIELMSISKENIITFIDREEKKWIESGEKYTRKIYPQHQGNRGAKQDYAWYTTEQGVLDQGGFYVE